MSYLEQHARPAIFLRSLIALAFFLALQFCAEPAFAHKGSDAYLDVQQTSQPTSEPPTVRDLQFVLSVAIRDLDLVLPVDADANGKVTLGEIKAVMPQVLALFDTVVQLDSTAENSAGACRLKWQGDGLESRGDGNYIRAIASARCSANEPLILHYELLKAQDATHRLLIAGRIGNVDLLSTMSPVQGTLVLKPADDSHTQNESAVNNPSGRLATLGAYFNLGMHHLLEGYDHLAFLLALVLPLQLSLWRRRKRPVAYDSEHSESAENQTWLKLLRTITAFTIGHSITLILATLRLTSASPTWVEPAIAASIAFTAWLNLRPVRWIRVDVLALLFGMVHGFGFAGLLLEAAAPSGLLPWALAGFNLGVEAGQLTAVAGWVLFSQFAVRQPWYRPVFVRGGSVVLIALATYWFWSRVR